MKKRASKKTGKKSIKKWAIGALAVLAIGAAASGGTEEVSTAANLDVVQVEEQQEAVAPEMEQTLPDEPEEAVAPDLVPEPEPAPTPELEPESTPAPAPIPAPEPESEQTTVAEEHDYVLNKNSKKIHYPSCSSVNQMKDTNKKFFTGTRDEAIAMGYEPCGNCHP